MFDFNQFSLRYLSFDISQDHKSCDENIFNINLREKKINALLIKNRVHGFIQFNKISCEAKRIFVRNKKIS
jgi:hypothetical protein